MVWNCLEQTAHIFYTGHLIHYREHQILEVSLWRKSTSTHIMKPEFSQKMPLARLWPWRSRVRAPSVTPLNTEMP
jgi:hypothetical protein